MRRVSLLTGAATGAALLAFLTGCSGSSATSANGSAATVTPAAKTTATSAALPTLRISGFSFGNPLTVRAGQKITVVNEDGSPHTVTADSGGAFDVEVGGRSSATLTAPTRPGTYKFHCTIHPMMRGTLIVQ